MNIDNTALQYKCHTDFYFFARYVFKQQRGYNWQQAAHHQTICNAMERVYNGECKRLIINIPPRYSKTQLAVIYFMAWALGKSPDAEFIHSSYSGRLAANNSYATRNLVMEKFYTEIFPNVNLVNDSKAKDEWRTDSGGCVYAVGAGGTITGYGAGKVRPGFGGCFPYDETVLTEIGHLKIGDIVTKEIDVKVWSLNADTNKIELKPIKTFWTNPGNDIVEIVFDGSTLKCTPNHEIYTMRGKVRADELKVSDRIIFASNALNNVNAYSKCVTYFSSAFSSIIDKCNFISRKFSCIVPVRLRYFFSYRSPRFSSFNLTNNARADIVFFRKIRSRLSAFKNLNGLISSKLCTWSFFKNRKSSVLFRVRDIFRSSTVLEIINPVISANAIQVADVSVNGAIPDKGLTNNFMNVLKGYFTVHRKAYAKISVIVGGCLKNFSFVGKRWLSFPGYYSADTSYQSCIANLISPFKTDYRQPVSINYIRHDDVTYCLEIKDNHNFIASQSQVVVSNCIILDDMHKADEARSEVMRNNVIEWFQNTLESRKNSPHTPIIVIMQRLHMDDLSGWLLEGNNGETWEHLCIPVINEDGEALWPEKHSLAKLREMEASSPYVFAGQYMQIPAPLDGGVFKPDNIQIIDEIPAQPIKWWRGWDLASVTNGDWTAGVKVGLMQDGRFIIGDVTKVRATPDERDAIIKNTSISDTRTVKISLPKDPGQAGNSQAVYFVRLLSGFKVKVTPETGDKVTRAEPFASHINVGNVLMLRGTWNKALIEEMRMFPNGSHDDQIDAMSRAANELITKPKRTF